jgi:lysophospholipase L1-like esterase
VAVRRIALGLAIATASTLLSVAGILFAGRALGYFAPAESAALIFPPHSRFEAETTEFRYSVTINSLGFRGPELRDRPLRVMTLGDSFTYGWGVDDDEPWPRVLERLLGEDVEVVNLGKAGAGFSDYAVIGEAAIPFLRPDLVIVAAFHVDDVRQAGDPPAVTPSLPAARSWSVADPRLPVATTITIEATRDHWRETALRVVEEFTEEEAARYRALDPEIRDLFESGQINPHKVRRGIREPRYDRSVLAAASDPEFIELERVAAARLASIRAATDAVGARLMVTVVPSSPFVDGRAHRSRVGFEDVPEMLTTDAADRQIERVAAGSPFLSITNEFRALARDREFYFPLDGHFNAAGHVAFAELIAPSIRAALDTQMASR